MKMRRRKYILMRRRLYICTCVEVHHFGDPEWFTWTITPGVYSKPFNRKPFPCIEKRPQL